MGFCQLQPLVVYHQPLLVSGAVSLKVNARYNITVLGGIEGAVFLQLADAGAQPGVGGPEC